MNMLTWLDLETTGLKPEDGAILEIGIILTTPDLIEIDRWSSPVNVVHARELCSDFVREMHSSSGLFDEVESAPGLNEVAVEAIHFLTSNGAIGFPMCGNTIGFDRKWLAVHAPNLHDAFHYRSLDVSSFKVAWAAWGKAPWTPPSRKSHRSLADLECSIAELRHYRASIS